MMKVACAECGGFVDNQALCVDDFGHETGFSMCKSCDGEGVLLDGDDYETCMKCGGHCVVPVPSLKKES